MFEDIASEAAIRCLYLYRELSEKDIDTMPDCVKKCWEVGKQGEDLIRQEIYGE